MKTTHVTNICRSSHTGTGLYRVDITDKTPSKLPDYRPIVEEYRSAETGSLLFKHRHAVRFSQWFDASGRLLKEYEEPVIMTLPRFEEFFGGVEFCNVI